MQVIRGDYKSYKFQRRNKNKEVITDLPEKMYFTVKQNFYQQKALIQKTLDKGIIYNADTNYYLFTIEPEDTNDLTYGQYIYDIEIIVDQKPKTIKIGTFEIKEEVTFKENEV